MVDTSLDDLVRAAVDGGCHYEVPEGSPHAGVTYTDIISALSVTVTTMGDLAVVGQPETLGEFRWTEHGATMFGNVLRNLQHCKYMRELGIPGPYYGG